MNNKLSSSSVVIIVQTTKVRIIENKLTSQPVTYRENGRDTQYVKVIWYLTKPLPVSW